MILFLKAIRFFNLWAAASALVTLSGLTPTAQALSELRGLSFVDQIKILGQKNSADPQVNLAMNTLEDFLKRVPKRTLLASQIDDDGSVRMAGAGGAYFIWIDPTGSQVEIIDTLSNLNLPTSFALRFNSGGVIFESLPRGGQSALTLSEKSSFFIPRPTEAMLSRSKKPKGLAKKFLALRTAAQSTDQNLTTSPVRPSFAGVLRRRTSELIFDFLLNQPGFGEWFVQKLKRSSPFDSSEVIVAQVLLMVLLAPTDSAYRESFAAYAREHSLDLNLASLDPATTILNQIDFFKLYSNRFVELSRHLYVGQDLEAFYEQLQQLDKFSKIDTQTESQISFLKSLAVYRLENNSNIQDPGLLRVWTPKFRALVRDSFSRTPLRCDLQLRVSRQSRER